MAATVTTHSFDLRRPSEGGDTADAGTTTGTSFAITSGGLTGTFTGGYAEDAAFTDGELTSGNIGTAASLSRWVTGAGICGPRACVARDPNEPHTVDGVGSGNNDFDFIQMAFKNSDGEAVDVTLTQLVFGYVGRFSWGGGTHGYEGTNGSFQVVLDSLDDNIIGLGDWSVFSGIATSLYKNSVFNLPEGSNLTDDVFGIMAGLNGSWKLRGVTVQYTTTPPPPPPPPEIPLPAAGWLMILGLGGLAALKRRAG
jgi:hypothetical protein